MEKLNLRNLRQQRKKRYWEGIAPYYRYVGGSLLGFILVIGFSFYGYGYFVHHLPERFPIYAFIAALMAFPVSSGSFRTYLREADIVFLLPIESHMPAYLYPCLRSAYIWHLLSMTVIWQILWPLFQAAQEHSLIVFSTIWLQLALMQGIVMVGVWQENQMRESRTRRIFAGVRTLTIGLLIYIIISKSIDLSLIAIGVASIVYLLTLRAVSQYTIHWERLIMLEHRSRSRWNTLFNLFIEMPRDQSPVRQTHWMHRMARIIAFKKTNAYRYLYLLTWIRSDLFLIVARLTIVGIILIVVMSSLWIKLGLLVLFAYVTKLQLSELEHYHRNVEISSIYPVQQNQRERSARFIATRVHLIILIVLISSFFVFEMLR